MIKNHSAIITATVIGAIMVVLMISLISPQDSAIAGTQPAPTAIIATLAAAETPLNHPTFVEQLPAGSDQPAVQVNIVEDAPAAEDGCSLSSTFPPAIQQWCSYLTQFSAEYGVEANLLASVMLQESGGNPQAYSKSGAVGLMQVMPKDGLAANFMCINGPCFASRPTSAELYDPAFNIQYGARMLSGLISKHGSLREALKAYGPMDMGYHYADLVLTIYEKYR